MPLPGQSPPVAAVVGEVTWTMNVELATAVPCGTVTGPQVRTSLAIPHDPAQPAPCDAIDHDRPALAGSVSVRGDVLGVPAPVV